MTDRQFYWGLSNGAVVLTAGGFFWFGLAMSAMPSTQPFFLALVAMAAALGAGAVRLRRKASGFRSSELDRQHPETRRILIGMRWTGLAQGLAVGLAVFLCVHVGRETLIWPAIGLVVGLHFVPLGGVFRVPVYYATGVLSAIISAAALMGAFGASLLPLLGLGMGATMWLTVIYLLRHADEMVRAALR